MDDQAIMPEKRNLWQALTCDTVVDAQIETLHPNE